MQSHKKFKQQKIAQGNLVGAEKFEKSLRNLMKFHQGQKVRHLLWEYYAAKKHEIS